MLSPDFRSFFRGRIKSQHRCQHIGIVEAARCYEKGGRAIKRWVNIRPEYPLCGAAFYQAGNFFGQRWRHIWKIAVQLRIFIVISYAFLRQRRQS